MGWISGTSSAAQIALNPVGNSAEGIVRGAGEMVLGEDSYIAYGAGLVANAGSTALATAATGGLYAIPAAASNAVRLGTGAADFVTGGYISGDSEKDLQAARDQAYEGDKRPNVGGDVNREQGMER